MDATTGLIVVIALFALVAVAALVVFRRRADVRIQGPGQTGLQVRGSNDPAPATTLEGITSRAGQVRGEDQTGRGTSLRQVDAHGDVTGRTSNPTDASASPKARPPVA